MNEVWKSVKGFENLYEVSNYGRVRSLTKTITHSDGRVRTYNGRVLRERHDTKGYVTAILCDHGKQTSKKVHRLVASAFIPNPQNFPFVNHKDENKSNNSVNNLEWCSAQYNSTYGTVQERKARTATNGKRAIQVIATLPDGSEEFYPSMAEFGRIHGKIGAEGNISLAIKGKRHTAYGRTWRIAE